LRRVKMFVQFWDSFESVIGGLFLTVSSLIIVVEVALRSLFRCSIIGSDEIACFAVIWSVFFTASIGLKQGIHVRIDIFLNLVPAGVRRFALIVGMAAVTFFSLYLTYSGIFLVREAIQIGDRTVGSLQIPLWLPQLIMPIGGFLLVLRSLAQLYNLVTTPFTEEADTGPVQERL